MKIWLEHMTRELCHQFYQKFEKDPAIYMDMSQFREYQYDSENVDAYFDRQERDQRILLAIMKDGEPIGEIKLIYIDQEKSVCKMGIHLQNDKVKGLGIGTEAEKMAVDYAFHKLGVVAVYADAVQKNTRSQHVLEKVGFQWIKEDEMYRYYVIRREDETRLI